MHPILPGPAGYRGSPDGCHRSDLSCPPARGVLHSHQSAGHQDRYMLYEGERERERGMGRDKERGKIKKGISLISRLSVGAWVRG